MMAIGTIFRAEVEATQVEAILWCSKHAIYGRACGENGESDSKTEKLLRNQMNKTGGNKNIE